jgi:chorismate mutase
MSKQPTTTKTLQVPLPQDKSEDEVLAAMAYDPLFRSLAATKACGSTAGDVDLTASMEVLRDEIERVNQGDLASIERTLTVQANTLDAIFNQLVTRAMNHQQYFPLMEKQLKLALKAQNQCRATLQTLTDIKRPSTVIAQQANVCAGLQQVNNHTDRPPVQKPAKQTIENDNDSRLDT